MRRRPAGPCPGAARRRRVLLLGHDARAGGEGVRGLAEAELRARPEHDLRPQPREVHRADRGRVQVVQGEVAVGDGVERVRVGPLEAEVRSQALAVEVPVERRRARPSRRACRWSNRRRGRSGARRGRTSRSRRAGGGPGRPAGRAAGGCRPGAAQSRWASASSTSVVISSSSSAIARAECERTSSARSVATWSLRERAVCSLPPTGPTSSVSRRSIAMWMSSSSLRELEALALELGGDRVEAARAASSARPRRARRAAAARGRGRATARRRRAPGASRRRSSELMPPEERVLGLRRSGTSAASRRSSGGRARPRRRRRAPCRPARPASSVIAVKKGSASERAARLLGDRELASPKPKRSR